MEKKAIFVARRLTLSARSTFATVSRFSYALPVLARSAVNDAYSHAESLYQTFTEVSSFSDFSQQMVNRLREQVTFLEDVASKLSQFVLESSPLRWLVSDMRYIISCLLAA